MMENKREHKQKKFKTTSDIVDGVSSLDSSIRLEATRSFRELLSEEHIHASRKQQIPISLVSEFVKFLDSKEFPELQIEAAKALTNIAYGSSAHTNLLIEHGAVDKFVELLNSPETEVSDGLREQAVWALGNVAGYSGRCCDIVLQKGALTALLPHVKESAKPSMLRIAAWTLSNLCSGKQQISLDQLNEHAKLSMLRNATWTLSNFCRGKPQPSFDQTRAAFPALQQLIHSNDQEVLTDACWTLSYLSDGTKDKVQAVIEANVCPRVVELLNHNSPLVLMPVLRTVGNIVTGDDMQTQHIVKQPVLPCLLNVLSNKHKKNIKKEACWIISNITAGNKEQIQTVIDANIIGPLVDLLQNSGFGIKKEAAWAISNATSGGSHDQIKYLVSQGCVKPLCDLLICPNPEIVTVCLEGLENILKVGEAEKGLGGSDVNLYAQMIEEAEGLEKLEKLQTHADIEIYNSALKLLETYWLEEEMMQCHL